MNRIRSNSLVWGASLFALLVGLCAAQSSYAVVLLDDDYEDELFLYDPNAPGIEVPNLPDETIFWVGRPADGIEGNGVGAARILMNASSQKAWINFVPSGGGKASHLGVGDTLTARIDYIPRGAAATTTSRNWRWGLYFDPTNPIVEVHTNSDGGGSGNPYQDAQGYSTFINMTGADADPNANTVQQAGKRTNPSNVTSLLGTSSAHAMINGGSEIVHVGNNEYTLEMIVNRVAASVVTFTTSIYDKTGGNVLLSTQTVTDNAVNFTGARNTNFSFIGFRDSGTATSFAAFDFTRVYVEGPAIIPEPTTLLLGALMAPLALLRRRR